MLPRNHPDRIQIAFDDPGLVANAGLILPATLALRLGLPQLVDRRLDLGDAPSRANTGDKIMTLVASALALGYPVQSRPGPAASHSTPSLTAPSATDPTSLPTERPPKLTPSRSASASCHVLSCHLALHSHCRPPPAPPKAPADRRQPPIYPNSSPDHRACNSLTLLPVSSRRPSVSIGGFGLMSRVRRA